MKQGIVNTMCLKAMKKLAIVSCISLVSLFSVAANAAATYSYSYGIADLGELSSDGELLHSEQIAGIGAGGLVEFERDIYFSVDSSVENVSGEVTSLEFFNIYNIDNFVAELYDFDTGEVLAFGDVDNSFTFSGLGADPLPSEFGIYLYGEVLDAATGVYGVQISAVPLPAAAWLFISGFLAIGGWSVFKRKREKEPIQSENPIPI